MFNRNHKQGEEIYCYCCISAATRVLMVFGHSVFRAVVQANSKLGKVLG